MKMQAKKSMMQLMINFLIGLFKTMGKCSIHSLDISLVCKEVWVHNILKASKGVFLICCLGIS